MYTMAAHLHRYKSELNCMEYILSDFKLHQAEMTPSDGGKAAVEEMGNDFRKLHQLSSQLRAIIDFEDEIERKVKNTLTLVRNHTQQRQYRISVLS